MLFSVIHATNDATTATTNDREEELVQELFRLPVCAVGKGRKAVIMVSDADRVPLVRSTLVLESPSVVFNDAMHALLQDVVYPRMATATTIAPPAAFVEFNNALVEVYDNAYATMGDHSDMALDLAEDSCIAVFSCYNRPDAPPRNLVITDKLDPASTRVVPMRHRSLIVFSLAFNARFLHRIELPSPSCASSPKRQNDDRWLGVTLRTSRTFLDTTTTREDGGFVLETTTGTTLTAATPAQKSAFFAARRRENTGCEKWNDGDDTASVADCTLSPGDLKKPVGVVAAAEEEI